MPDKILVIDDHEETIRVVKFILEQRGYEVISAGSGASGLSLAKSDKPNLILLDVMMPDIDGVDVCRQLRANSDFDTVPIIMFTARDQVDDKWAGFEAGADDYLTKPTDPEEMDRRIQVLLRRASKGEETFDASDTLIMDRVRMEQAETAVSGQDEADGQALMPVQPPPQLDREEVSSNLIAVIGVRGGVGTTTVAINLAASMADNAGQTHLVDLDLTQGHVALYLQRKIQHESLNDLSRLTNVLELGRRWQKFSVPEGIGLQLLLSRPNVMGDWPVPTPNQIEVLVDALVQSSQYIVVDAGRGVLPTTLPVLRRAGHIIICTKPERVSLLAAKRLIKILPAYMGQGAQKHVLMTTMGLDNSLPQPAVEEFIHHELLATIPISYKEMAYAVNHNAPLVRLRPTSKAGEVFRKIALQVAV
ncbi:MAG: response regulator [Candidatus Promineifilaceae bacterium]